MTLPILVVRLLLDILTKFTATRDNSLVLLILKVVAKQTKAGCYVDSLYIHPFNWNAEAGTCGYHPGVVSGDFVLIIASAGIYALL